MTEALADVGSEDAATGLEVDFACDDFDGGDFGCVDFSGVDFAGSVGEAFSEFDELGEAEDTENGTENGAASDETKMVKNTTFNFDSPTRIL
ncbi:hypothetical protein KBI23_25160 [bacterium]|nr:hypothetical protein [bacterium]